MREQHDTVIIGAGQAGLVMSSILRQRGREHVILERYRIAERWRSERWDSLYFQLPNKWLSLPGMPYGGSDPHGFSHYSDVVRMIEKYSVHVRAPVRTGVEVQCLTASDDNEYLLDTSAGPIAARNVILATGPFQRPLRSAFSSEIPPIVYQVDATHYRNPGQLPEGSVIVIGSGNSGCQIADELQRSGRRVILSMGRHTRVPRRYRGKDVIWWYDTLGRFDVEITTLPRGKHPPTTIMTGTQGGYDLSPRGLANAGVRLTGRVLGCEGDTLHLDVDAEDVLIAAENGHKAFFRDADAFITASRDPSSFEERPEPATEAPPTFDSATKLNLRHENISSIVWAVGHEFSLEWVKLPILTPTGAPLQKRGVTASRGVYFLGLHWMHTFRSAILPFVERDAIYIADHLDSLSTPSQ